MKISLKPTLAGVLYLLTLSGHHLQAQTVPYGGVGDPASAPGDPASSYALSGVDHINLYNGLVNLTIPLHSIGGRGAVTHNMVFPVQRQWEVDNVGGLFVPSTDFSSYMGGKYTGGYLDRITVSGNTNQCVTNGAYSLLGPILTYIRWTRMDGTQVIFTDLNSNGQPQAGPTYCGQSYQPYNRGRNFRSQDGRDTTFVANADVVDADSSTAGILGTIITRDGTKYFFQDGADTYTSAIEDRNGNLINFTYSPTSAGAVYAVTDPVGRAISINFTETPASNQQDVILYPGFQQTQKVTVTYALLQNALAPNESIQTYNCLFPELQGSTSMPFNPYVVASIQLADRTSYQVQYNSYGEPSRLTLPTGAYYVYKYPEANSCSANSGSGVVNLGNGNYGIYRPVQERDEYANGSGMTGRILFNWSNAASGGDPNFTNRPTTVATLTYQDANGNTLRTDKHSFWGNPSPTNAPSSNATEFANWWLGLEYQTDVIDPSLGNEQSTQRVYRQQNCPIAGEAACPYGANLTVDNAPTHDPLLCQANTTQFGASTKSTLFLYDSFNNPTDQYDFDFGQAPNVTGACPTSFSGALRHTQSRFLFSNSIGMYTATGTNLITLPVETKVMDGFDNLYSDTQFTYDDLGIANAPNIVGHDNSAYASDGVMRGNLTSISQYLSPGARWLTSTIGYDIAGNVVSVTDPRHNRTTFDYTDNYATGSANTYAHMTTYTDALSQKQYWSYDYNSGEPITYTDINNQIKQYTYADPLDRLTQVINPDGGRTNYQFQSPTDMYLIQDQTTAGDRALVTHMVYDGLGRGTEVQQADGSQAGYVHTTTTYDVLGHIMQTTNPSNPGDGLDFATKYSRDALGNIEYSMTADGSIAKTSYGRNQVTVIDQAGKGGKTYFSDGLGRLTGVEEYMYDAASLASGAAQTGNATNYVYNPLGNLTNVYQTGGVNRTFVYDSLSRLTSATNPESGTEFYSYDDAGNLQSRTDARNVTATYQFDALNRLRSINYNDGTTPAVSYTYCQGTNNCPSNSAGHLITVSKGISVTNYLAFDSMGRVTNSNQQIAGNTYNFSNYGYNLAGALTTETFPSGRTVTTGYDGANRVTTVGGTFNGAQTPYITKVQYYPHGAPYYYIRGNSLWSVWYYNSRLQPVESYEVRNNQMSQVLSLSCWDWGTQVRNTCGPPFASTGNNGTLLHKLEYFSPPGQADNFSCIMQSYSYDNRNRLTGFSYTNTDFCSSDSNTSSVARTMSYDAIGNMATTSGATNASLTPASLNAFVNPNTQVVDNRIHLPGFQYDSAGNQTNLGTIVIGYDGENRQVSTTDPSDVASVTYAYDGLGQRVQKSETNGATTVYIYDALGQLAAEYSSVSVPPPCATCYLSYDYLGSVSMVTEGSPNASVVSRHDYLPFGEEHKTGLTSEFGANDGLHQRFTGQDRDAENAPPLDYFYARYFSGAPGRFLSPDPGGAGVDITNPQSWNGYSYVLGNPLSSVDPSGRSCVALTNDAGTFIGDDGLGSLCPGATDPDITNVFDTVSGTVTAVGFDSPQSGLANPNTVSVPAMTGKVFSCAADFASGHSIAGGLHALGVGNNGGIGGFIVNTFGGNTFSGITNLVSTMVSPNSTSDQVLAQLEKADLRGPLQGIPARLLGLSQSPARYGLTGLARSSAASAAFNAVTGANENLVTLSGEVGLSAAGITGAEFATGVGEAKFALDAVTYFSSLVGCATGVIP